MKHLLLISIGPVQSFISAARRCRDLWFGSWMLSELGKAAARACWDICGPQTQPLIFPYAPELRDLDPGTRMSVANKIVVEVPSGLSPDKVANAAIDGLRARLRELCNDAFARVGSKHGQRDPAVERLIEFDKAREQVQDLIEIAWASAPVDGDTYSAARERAEALLSARKVTRLWDEVKWGSDALKSSLDGERESVLHEHFFDEVEKGHKTEHELHKGLGVRRNERLCGVGLLKRHGVRKVKGEQNTEHRFVSTPHLASLPLLARLAKDDMSKQAKERWEQYLRDLRAADKNVDLEESIYRHHPVLDHHDGQLLFEDRLEERYLHITDPQARRDAVRKARGALDAFFKHLDLPRPLPYFAVVVADGDRMGDVIENQTSAEKHRKLSEALSKFASGAQGIIEADDQGQLIYAGGDDVLAFVPLHCLIERVQQLQQSFREHLQGFRTKDGQQPGQQPTLSIGIAIAHFMGTMGGALRLAWQAERLAKQTRNALAIVLDKRSGPPITIHGQWGTVDTDLMDFVRMHRADEVPDGLAFELMELERLRAGAPEGERDTLDKLIQAEAKRILHRKQPKSGRVEISQATLQRLLPVPAQLAERLLVARILADARRIADVIETQKEGGK